MRMKILMGYDGSNVSKDAMEIAITHAKAFDAEVHVVMSVEKGSEGDVKEIADGESALEYAKSVFEDKGINCETHLLVRGLSPGEDLIDFSNAKGVDEIVMGVKKRSKVGKFLMGSTAQYVILNAKCPVVTVK
jgi:nucleotide-binding universal stress UspA family protein